MSVAKTFSPDENDFLISSTKTIRDVSSICALDKKAREVRIVSMPHCWIAAVIASGPAVKFRLTGTLPARRMPTLTSAPPTEAGSTTPTIDSLARCFRSQREKSRLPIRALPKDNSTPVVSAMQKEDQCCFAERINLPCSSSWALRR